MTTISTGNILIPPAELAKAVKYSLENNPTSNFISNLQATRKWLNMTADQARYRFLLDGGMVNSSATMREVMGLIRDVGVRGDVLDRAFQFYG